jgi:glycosyltransferase involved in cell wall biosynthesis
VKLSVIIPTYKDNERLVKCVECLAKQIGNQSVEIIVVDNAGDAALKELLRKFPDTSYLVEAKPGSYAARNAGLRIASGDVIAFTDSDCLPEMDWVAQIFRLVHSSDADIFAGRVIVFPQNPDAVTSWEIADMIFGFPVERRVNGGGGGVTANLVARRSAFDAIGQFDGDVLSGADMEWCMKARKSGLKLVYNGDLAVRHPARRRREDYLVKAKRVAGAMAERFREEDLAKHVFRHLTRLALPPLRDWGTAAGDANLSFTNKLRGIWARTVFHYYIKWQILRYLLWPTLQKERR